MHLFVSPSIEMKKTKQNEQKDREKEREGGEKKIENETSSKIFLTQFAAYNEYSSHRDWASKQEQSEKKGKKRRLKHI